MKANEIKHGSDIVVITNFNEIITGYFKEGDDKYSYVTFGNTTYKVEKYEELIFLCDIDDYSAYILKRHYDEIYKSVGISIDSIKNAYMAM